MFRTISLITLWLLSLSGVYGPVQAPLILPKTIQFSGYTWTVRAGSGGPGPNTWVDANAWVDVAGYLHLKLTNEGNGWSCAEVTTTTRLGFGTYQFELNGPIDQLDQNVVLGLFNYPPADVGPDGTNEIDIEFARWGDAANPNGNYTVWPAQVGPPTSQTFEFNLNNDETTQRFHWTPRSIAFQSLHGHTNGNTNEFASWVYQPPTVEVIPQNPMPVHLNLWLFQGNAPTNGQEVEIIISRFTFTPFERVYLPVILKS